MADFGSETLGLPWNPDRRKDKKKEERFLKKIESCLVNFGPFTQGGHSALEVEILCSLVPAFRPAYPTSRGRIFRCPHILSRNRGLSCRETAKV